MTTSRLLIDYPIGADCRLQIEIAPDGDGIDRFTVRHYNGEQQIGDPVAVLADRKLIAFAAAVRQRVASPYHGIRA